MADICIGFEVHQPYRLNRQFSPVPEKKKDGLFDLYFDGLNKEILLRVADKCYNPATKIILEKLDEGFSCAFSLSGIVIEQLQKWSPDTLSLFEQVANHHNCELIGQTYYHSIAGCFGDKSEFIEQAKKHDLGSIERVVVAGEVLNPEVWSWLYNEVFSGKLPIFDHPLLSIPGYAILIRLCSKG